MLVMHATGGRCGQRSDERFIHQREENDGDAPTVGADDQEWNDDDGEGRDDDAGYVSSFKQSSMGGRGGKTRACARNGCRGKKAAVKRSDAKGDADAEEGRQFWSVDDMIALIRAKRGQDAHLQGMGTAYAHMKPRELKWLDVAQRLKKVGVDREAERCRKKWDNLIQQFKKVHHFQGHDDDEDGSTRGSSQITGSPAGFGKRKSTRQQTFEALTECMEKHGALVASTMESNSKRQCSIQIWQCEALEAEVEV
ncbi:hypothetical protein CBR_g30618 [Chara braunii]|uniref:Myb-like domain-containing protein n=1 Tax=Chara braunii TaxID=69332 RepID=A0A388LDF9_CHABU|nr:hypothetical protein CBR_g30618 [Chara braunii]|eukprot:GBG80252.1 hypothetical protein CBR_g30618 [Chara braunii]